MAEEEDFSSLPLTDRFTHKVWKVRKAAYEEAAKQFALTPSESDPFFRPFLSDVGLWKSAVLDSNVAAQQEGITALCAFLKFGGRDAAVRTRGHTITPIVEKCLSSTRAATKQNAIEALLLYIEIDVAGPVIEDILPGLANKVPKNVAATLNALNQIVHNYGCKIVDPKPILKALPKAFGAADKNIRAEATNLTVELYRWLREAMKPLFWGELKPTQQTDLEAQFEKVKAEPPPKQERLLRSQQEIVEAAPEAGDGYEEDGDEPADVGELDAFSLAEPVDVSKKIPVNFSDLLASSKWKDRKEAIDGLYEALNVPRIKETDFGEVNRGLAKCMKDANVAVVTQAALCIELLAKGLRHGYAKYRAVVMQPIMERLKEKKQTVSDALGAALDAVFTSTSLSDCMEDITTYLGNKNPQVKEGTMKFLIRCLRTTRDVPSKSEISTVCDSSKKLLAESTPVLRDGGAEILGTVMKIIGERAMTPLIEGLDDIRKTKVREFFATAEVKAKEKPKPAPAAPRAAPGGPKKVVGGKRPVAKKAAPATAAPEMPAASAVQAPSKPAGSGNKLGMPKSGGIGGLKAPLKRNSAAPALASPRRPGAGPPIMPSDDEPIAAPPQPRIGASRGLAGRSLTKPTAAAPAMPPANSPPPVSSFSAAERAELEELRAANERLARQVDDMRQERSKFLSEIQELKNQNAGLIEDHTRDVLSIKAKETQLVRARSDAEATEGVNDRLRRELERLKRALSKAETIGGGSTIGSPVITSPIRDEMGIFHDAALSGTGGYNRASFASSRSEEKENGDVAYPKSKISPELRYGSGASSGRGSPARGYRAAVAPTRDDGSDSTLASRRERPVSSLPQPSGGGGESWRRAAEVTSQLKARIEQMKAKQGFARP